MCLTSRHKMPKRIPKKGYVSVKKCADNYMPATSWNFPKEGYRVGAWHKADESPIVRYGVSGDRYLCGFHVWVSLRAAIRWNIGGEEIWECEVRDVHRFGEQIVAPDSKKRYVVMVARERKLTKRIFSSEVARAEKSRLI